MANKKLMRQIIMITHDADLVFVDGFLDSTALSKRKPSLSPKNFHVLRRDFTCARQGIPAFTRTHQGISAAQPPAVDRPTGTLTEI